MTNGMGRSKKENGARKCRGYVGTVLNRIIRDKSHWEDDT